jgi:hypothetical protein
MSAPNEPNQQILEAVLDRAAVDQPFRRHLLASAAEAVHAAFGIRLPDGFRIRFIEKDPDTDLLVVLPDVRGGSDELSEEDLENVAGGTDPPPPIWS